MPDAARSTDGVTKGDTILVKARPDYRGRVEAVDHSRLVVRPLPGQGVTLRARTIWRRAVIRVLPHAPDEAGAAEPAKPTRLTPPRVEMLGRLASAPGGVADHHLTVPARRLISCMRRDGLVRQVTGRTIGLPTYEITDAGEAALAAARPAGPPDGAAKKPLTPPRIAMLRRLARTKGGLGDYQLTTPSKRLLTQMEKDGLVTRAPGPVNAGGSRIAAARFRASDAGKTALAAAT